MVHLVDSEAALALHRVSEGAVFRTSEMPLKVFPSLKVLLETLKTAVEVDYYGC